MRSTITVFVLVLALVIAGAGTAAGTVPLGARAGFSLEPDQVVFGAHAKAFEPYRGWWVVPVAELGFGDNVTTVALSGDMLYGFPELQTSDWGFYLGGGLGWAHYSWDGGDTGEIGLNLVGGMTRRLLTGNELLLELRIGIDELPDVKIVTGITFF